MGLFNKKDKTVNRKVAFSDIYSTVIDLLALADLAERQHTVPYDIYYDDGTKRFNAVAMRNGLVYNVEVFADDSGVSLGEFIEVKPNNNTQRSEHSINVTRSLNLNTGKEEMRWLSIASVAVLNRSGEIDSRELFDSFISFAERTNQYPVLNVYHLGEGSVIGQTDYLKREGYVYIASGTFNDDKWGRLFFEALKTRDDWGNSIEFFSPRSYIERFEVDGTVLEIPVYKTGINTGITILKEEHASSVFTNHKSTKGVFNYGCS